MNKPNSVAAILERERETTVKEWLRRVNLLPTLTHIPLSDEERTLHLLRGHPKAANEGHLKTGQRK